MTDTTDTTETGAQPLLISTGDTVEDRARAIIERIPDLPSDQRDMLINLCLTTGQLRFAERQLRRSLEVRNTAGAELMRQRDQAQGALAEVEAEVDWLTTRIREEARDRDWCSEYDRWADEVNARNVRVKLPLRMQQVGSTFTVSFSGTIPYGNDDWADTIRSVLRSMRDHADAEWIEDWTVEWSER